MTMLERKNFEKVLKKFNDDEMGGGFVYFIYKQGKKEILVQLDLCDYSSCELCGIEDIEDFQFIKEDDGIYLKLYEKYEGINHAWIDEIGVQM